MKEAILAFDGVRMMYHTRTKETLAAENMSFSIYEGEFVAVIGPSGCGKTTVLSLAAGLLSPSAGSVCVRGKKVHRGMPCFGYMLQKDELFPWRTVEQNLFLPLEIKKINTPENRNSGRTSIRLDRNAYYVLPRGRMPAAPANNAAISIS